MVADGSVVIGMECVGKGQGEREREGTKELLGAVLYPETQLCYK